MLGIGLVAAPPAANLWAQEETAKPETSQSTPFPIVDTQEVWENMTPFSQPLPTWARVFAASLPRTTAAMLRLDDLHRRHNPLGNRLASYLQGQ